MHAACCSYAATNPQKAAGLRFDVTSMKTGGPSVRQHVLQY
jgi:hypothetical protein